MKGHPRRLFGEWCQTADGILCSQPLTTPIRACRQSRLYVSGLGGKLVETSDGTTWFFATNHLGTIAARMNVGGQLMETYRYLPYGERYAGTQTPHQYTGKERDAESGLDYFGARYLASAHGRWMAVDSNEGAITHPQSLNRYSFVLSNPVNFIDPAGAEAQMWCEVVDGEQICHISLPAQPPHTESLPGSHNFFEGAQDAVKVTGSERDHTVPDLPGLEVSQAVTMAQGILRSRSDCEDFFGEGASSILDEIYSGNDIRLWNDGPRVKTDNGVTKVTFAGTVNAGNVKRIFINTNSGFMSPGNPVIRINNDAGRVEMDFIMVDFLNRSFSSHLGDFRFNEDTARAFVTLHELGHLLSGPNQFPSDHGN